MFILLSIIIVFLIIIVSSICYPKWGVYNYHLFHKIYRMYGPPTFVDPFKKGAGIWKFDKNNINYNKIPFKRIMILDTKTDPLYITITYDIDSKKMCDILQLDKSIVYDRTTNELTLRGGDIHTILSLFVFIDKYNRDIVKKTDSSQFLVNTHKELLNNYNYLLGVKKNNMLKLIET